MNDIKSNIILCNQCHLVIDLNTKQHSVCPRCHHKLLFRKNKSIQKTFALTITALILYFPANFYPIMIIKNLHDTRSNTIMSGVLDLIHHDMFFIGAIVFTASIVIPLIKIISLLFLLYRVKIPSKSSKAHTTLFHFLEFIGKWSMLDIYVIAVFMALVNLGFVTKVSTGPASIYFTLVVLSTLLASQSFDSRLLWDKTKGSLC